VGSIPLPLPQTYPPNLPVADFPTYSLKITIYSAHLVFCLRLGREGVRLLPFIPFKVVLAVQGRNKA